jgi:hypothetical protein
MGCERIGTISDSVMVVLAYAHFLRSKIAVWELNQSYSDLKRFTTYFRKNRVALLIKIPRSFSFSAKQLNQNCSIVFGCQETTERQNYVVHCSLTG